MSIVTPWTYYIVANNSVPRSPGSSNSNNNNQKHRRSEYDDLFAREYQDTYQWE